MVRPSGKVPRFAIDAWLAHLRPGLNPIGFPRDFGLNRYPPVETEGDYVTRLEWGWEKDSYVAVYSAPQIEAGVIDTLFVDIDYAVLGFGDQAAAYGQIRGIRETYPNIRVNYSAAKGFHVYFDFDMVKRELFTRAGVKAWLRSLGLKVKEREEEGGVDPTVILDVRRMARVPFTVNTKTGRMCLPVTESPGYKRNMWDMSFDALKEWAGERFGPHTPLTEIPPISVAPDNRVVREIVALGLEEADTGGHARPRTETVEADRIPWIDRLLERPVTDARHRLTWLVLAPYLVNVRKTPAGEAASILRDYLRKCSEVKPISDSIEALAEYFTSYAASTGLKPPRLSTLKEKYPDVYAVVMGDA